MAQMSPFALTAALSLAVPCPAHAHPIDRWRPLIAEASSRFGIPSTWIERVMRAESAGRTMLAGRPIRSRAGAMGLMQLMPGTWADMRARLRLGTDPDDPRDNVMAGSFYLRLMYDRFGYPGLFAAYNAGPARYAGFLAGRQSLPGETVAYLAAVSGIARRGGPLEVTGRIEKFFVLQSKASISTSSAPERPAPSSLFVIQRLEQ